MSKIRKKMEREVREDWGKPVSEVKRICKKELFQSMHKNFRSYNKAVNYMMRRSITGYPCR